MRLFLWILLLSLPCSAEDALSFSAFNREGTPVPGYGVLHRESLCIVTAMQPDQDVKGAIFTHSGGKRYDGSKAKIYQQGHSTVYIFPKVEFEPLCLPSAVKWEPELADGFGGLQFLKPQDRSAFRWLLPASLWEVEVGWTREELEQKRGKLSSWREEFKDHSFVIRDDTPILYRVQYRSGQDRENRDRCVEIELTGSTSSYLGEFHKAEALVEKLEGAFGKPRVFTASYEPSKVAGKQFIAHWLQGDRSLTLRLSHEPLALSAHLVVSESKTSRLVRKVMEKHQMGGAPGSLVAAYKDWVGGL